MSFCDTTCTFTFFSVRHDQIKSVKEENEPLLTAVYIPAMRPVRTLVTFSLCCGKLHDFNESAYSLCLFDLVELLLARQFSSQLELRSLVRRFGLLFLFTKKMSRNPTNSFLSVACLLRHLLIADFIHVFLFYFQNRLQRYELFPKRPQLFPTFFSSDVISLIFSPCPEGLGCASICRDVYKD